MSHALFKKDKATLDQLIDGINEKLVVWNALSPKPNLKCKITAVVVPVITWTGLIATTAYLSYLTVLAGNVEPTSFSDNGSPILPPNATVHPDDFHWDCRKVDGRYLKYYHTPRSPFGNGLDHDYGRCQLDTDALHDKYLDISTCVGFTGFVANTALSFLLLKRLWIKTEALTISESEWGIPLKSLQILSKQLNQIARDALPTDAQHIQDLDRELARLNGDHQKSKEDAIDIFTQIVTVLGKIRSDLIIKRKPISALTLTVAPAPTTDVVVDIDGDDESVPLLNVENPKEQLCYLEPTHHFMKKR
jgi:hypothetical protein